MYEFLGDHLESLCREGRSEAILIAPFIKRTVFTRLLEVLPAEVTLICVTRWRPEEVAVGVSDPDIWLDVQGRAGTILRICPALHAKYYRVDTKSLVGSANLTGMALGWSSAPNLEILYPVDGTLAEWQAFEQHVFTQSVLCIEAIYQQTIAITALIQSEMPLQPVPLDESELLRNVKGVQEEPVKYRVKPTTDLSRWLPQTRQPSDLYLAYS